MSFGGGWRPRSSKGYQERRPTKQCNSAVQVVRSQVTAAALLLAAAHGLVAAAETVHMECQSPLWAGLPLAKQQPSAEEYDPSSVTYYKDWALKHILPPFVLCCITAALLLSFLLWRLAKLATCMRCMRSPELRGKPAHDLLAARSTRWLRAVVPLLAAGVIAGAGYGFSTIEPGIEPSGVSVYEQTQVSALFLHFCPEEQPQQSPGMVQAALPSTVLHCTAWCA